MPILMLETAIAFAILGFASGYFWRTWSRRSERRIDRFARAIVEGMPGHGWSNDPDGKFTYVSPPALRYYGVEDSFIKMTGVRSESFHEAYSTMLGQIIHPDDLMGTLNHWNDTLKSGCPATYEYRLRRHDGVYLWHRLAVHPSRDAEGNITAWYGTQIDIEDQKVAEFALRKRERELQILIDALPANIWCCDLDGYVTHFSKRLERFFGCQLQDIPREERKVSRANPGLIHPDDAGIAEDLLKRSLSTGEPLSGRYRMRRADGVYRWTEQRGELLRDEEGNPVQWYGVAIDIDALKREEDALRYREQELRQLVDTIPMMMWTIAGNTDLIDFNRSLLEFTGISPDHSIEARGINVWWAMSELVHPDDLPLVSTLFRNQKGDAGVVGGTRYRLRRADGVYRWVEGRYAGLEDSLAGGVRRYGFLIDVEEEMQSQAKVRDMQERLGDASRAASLAELAAAIAHEVNQPLTAIISNAEACYRWLTMTEPNVSRAINSADAIVKNASDAAEIISSIRALFRRTPGRRGLENPNSVILEVVNLVKNTDLGLKFGMTTALSEDVSLVEMDRVQIQQVLVNIIRNGLEAIAAKGGQSAPLTIRSRRSGTGIAIDIIDEGIGMPKEERFGQAFFTTKSSGMGMGLVICRSVIEAHGGELLFLPNKPEGTIVSFTLPNAGS